MEVEVEVLPKESETSQLLGLRELRARAPARVLSTRSATEVPRRDMATKNKERFELQQVCLRMRVSANVPWAGFSSPVN